MPVVINGSTGVSLADTNAVPTAAIQANAVTTAKIADANITQAKIATAVIPVGVGQTTTNVTGSRANGVTYTNTTGRPITVYVSASSSSASGNAYVDGVTVFLSLCRSTYFNFVPICFIVPAGSTYSIANFDYYSYWVELR